VRIQTRWRATNQEQQQKQKPYEGKSNEQNLDTSDLLIQNALLVREGPSVTFGGREITI
jgi:hypothetical protein